MTARPRPRDKRSECRSSQRRESVSGSCAPPLCFRFARSSMPASSSVVSRRGRVRRVQIDVEAPDDQQPSCNRANHSWIYEHSRQDANATEEHAEFDEQICKRRRRCLHNCLLSLSRFVGPTGSEPVGPRSWLSPSRLRIARETGSSSSSVVTDSAENVPIRRHARHARRSFSCAQGGAD